MYRIATVLILLAASAVPASAGGDWYDDGTYETHRWSEYRAYYGRPHRAPVDEVYIPYGGTYFVDEPDYYGASCEVEREWRHGRYREKIECDDD